MLVHDRSLVHWHDGFRSRRAVAQSTMRSLHIVASPPLFDDDLCLFQRVKNLAIKQFISDVGYKILNAGGNAQPANHRNERHA